MDKIKEIEIEKLSSDIHNVQESIAHLTKTVDAMGKMIHMLRGESNTKEAVKAITNAVFNKDGLPLNTVYVGQTKKVEAPILLTVETDGSYKIGNNTYKSLSAAAEAVSGVRRSGWTFWKTFDGKTLKEAFK